MTVYNLCNQTHSGKFSTRVLFNVEICSAGTKNCKKILLGISFDLNCKTLFSQLLQSEMFVENCHRKLK